jgi:hypothetical protein
VHVPKNYRPTVVVTDEQMHKIQGLAYSYGWMRVEPRKAWTDAERREVLTLVLQRFVDDLTG